MTRLYRDLSGNGAGVDLFTAVSRSGTIAAAGVAQQLAPANPSRRGIVFQNLSGTDLWVNIGGTAAVDTPGSIRIAAGDKTPLTDYSDSGRTGAVSIVGATLGQKFTCVEE